MSRVKPDILPENNVHSPQKCQQSSLLGLAVTQVLVSGLRASWVTRATCPHSNLGDFSGLTSVSRGTFATGLDLLKSQ